MPGWVFCYCSSSPCLLKGKRTFTFVVFRLIVGRRRAAHGEHQPTCGAEDGSVKVFIVARVMFHHPHAFPRRHVKDEHAKDAAQLRSALRRACQRTWRRTWASGPGRRAPSSPRHHRRCHRLVHLALRWGRNWAAQWHLARAICGQALPGVPRKALLCLFNLSLAAFS